MKRLLLFFVILLPSLYPLHAEFLAKNLSDPYTTWNTFQLRQLTCEIEIKGLLYETTITYEMVLAPNWYGNNPPAGNYEITWDFDLPESAIITDCWLKPPKALDFVRAQIIDMTSAEHKYQQYPSVTNKLLLRERILRDWYGNSQQRFRMQYSPVTLSTSPVIKIRYLLPCLPFYNVRRLVVPLTEFYVYKDLCNPKLAVKDDDNLNVLPQEIHGAWRGMVWQKRNERWETEISSDYLGYDLILGIATESADRSYLQVFSDTDAQYYQLSLLPPMLAAERKSKSIMLAVDLTEEKLSRPRNDLLKLFEQTVQLAVGSHDSMTMVYSGFTPVIYDSVFSPVSTQKISAMISRVAGQPAPKLNTLPHLLRQAVDVFNRQHKSGEIWLLTNAYTHSDPPASAMEIITQTLKAAKQPIVFKIINADNSWMYYWRINSQNYYGNDYLYENLARLSSGAFINLRNYAYYNILDAMLDGVAPIAASVEVNPQPQNGVSYSRCPLNSGRVNFPLTMPYYEIGLFDGTAPFRVNFYGMIDGTLFAKELNISSANQGLAWRETKLFWLARYIQNLLLEPQSYETIDYIEKISVQERLLTQYSGFVIPAQTDIIAFKRLQNDDAITAVKPEERTDSEQLQASLEMELDVSPNPFNSTTMITIIVPDVDRTETVHIKIFNYLGQLIREQSSSSFARKIQFRWDGMDRTAQAVPSGIYLIVVQMGREVKKIKATVLR
jgi:hypothetical protein